MTALVIRLGPPLSVRLRSAVVNVVRLIGLENVTSTEPTAVFLGFGVTAAIEEIVGGVSSTNTLKVAAGETLPAASSP